MYVHKESFLLKEIHDAGIIFKATSFPNKGKYCGENHGWRITHYEGCRCIIFWERPLPCSALSVEEQGSIEILEGNFGC